MGASYVSLSLHSSLGQPLAAQMLEQMFWSFSLLLRMRVQSKEGRSTDTWVTNWHYCVRALAFRPTLAVSLAWEHGQTATLLPAKLKWCRGGLGQVGGQSRTTTQMRTTWQILFSRCRPEEPIGEAGTFPGARARMCLEGSKDEKKLGSGLDAMARYTEVCKRWSWGPEEFPTVSASPTQPLGHPLGWATPITWAIANWQSVLF